MQTIEKAERTVIGGVRTGTAQAAVAAEDNASEPRGEKTRAMLRARLGDDIFTSWFHTIEFEAFDAKTVKVSVPVKFLKTWIQSHYSDDLLACCRAEFKGAEKVEVVLRQPSARSGMRADGQPANVSPESTMNGVRNAEAARGTGILAAAQAVGRTSVGGF
jgi:chromosomal replication initiator protein